MKSIASTIKRIERQVKSCTIPSVTVVSFDKDPYRVLISCILSLRTKEKTTVEASNRLFKVAGTCRSMVQLSPLRIQRLIYPVGFYRIKAKTIFKLSRALIERFHSRVPNTLDELLTLKGVGRKTANLVLGLGYNIPAICVDTHVHRISNRLGWIRTKVPYETELALQRIIPKKLWIDLNTILVTFGQNICLPVSPLCTKCSVRKLCKRIGVLRFR